MLKRITLASSPHKLETAQIVHKEMVFLNDSTVFLITVKRQEEL